MRICMLLDRDGWRRDGRVRRELRALEGDGHRVTLLHRGPQDADDEVASDGGVTRTVLPRRGGATLARMPWSLRRLVLTARFAWRAARERPDAVHAHDLPMLPPAWAAARLSGAALVYDSHEYQLGVAYHGRLARVLTRVLQRLLVPRCDAVIVVSDAIAALMAARYGGTPVVVGNLPELDWGRPVEVADLRATLGIGGEPLLLAQGAVGDGRGAEQLVDALSLLDRGHAVFLGDFDPGWAEAVAARASALGVDDRVHLPGSVPVEALLAHTRQADVGLVLVDPSRASLRLAMPNKLFEYLVAGVPVVASEGTASADLVTALGAGWAAPYGDAHGLAAVLERALAACGDEALRGRLAPLRERFTWEREKDSLLAVYHELAASRSAATRDGDAVSNATPGPSSRE
jgi:glycosyltransferase involved in cell wall biosynthesis